MNYFLVIYTVVCNVKSITLTFTNRRCVTFPFSFPFKCYKNFAVYIFGSWFFGQKKHLHPIDSAKNIMPFIKNNYNNNKKTNKFYPPFTVTLSIYHKWHVLLNSDVHLSFFLVDVIIIQNTLVVHIPSDIILYMVDLNSNRSVFWQHNNNFRHQYIDFKMRAFQFCCCCWFFVCWIERDNIKRTEFWFRNWSQFLWITVYVLLCECVCRMVFCAKNVVFSLFVQTCRVQ